jgi:hypothetical protein
MMRRALIILLARSWSCSKKSLPVVPSASAFVAGPAKHTSVRFSRSREQSHQPYRSFVASAIAQYTRSPVLLLLAKPKKAGSTVDSYQTVSVNCSKCQQQLFRYKKKNGTKSNLVKCYVERICEDSAGVLALAASKQQKQTVSSVSSSTSPDSDTNENNTTKKDRKRKRKQNPTKNLINSDNGNDKAATTPEHKEPNVVTIPTQLDPEYSWECPSCHTQFARSSLIHGRPALKMVGGKIRMTKK